MSLEDILVKEILLALKNSPRLNELREIQPEFARGIEKRLKERLPKKKKKKKRRYKQPKGRWEGRHPLQVSRRKKKKK
jgi:DNA modification methylase